MKSLSLKFRFAIVMSIGALALVGGMGALSTRFAQQDLLATLSGQQLGLLSRAAEDIDAKLHLATNSLASSAAALPPDVLVDPDRFVEFQSRHPALTQLFDELLLVDSRGTVAAAFPARPGLIGLDLIGRQYIRDALAQKVPTLSDPLYAKSTGAPLVGIAAPIVGADGSVVAVLVGTLPVLSENFLGGLARDRVGQTGYLSVVTSSPEPIYLVHPDRARIMQKVPRARSRAMAIALDAKAPGVTVSTLEDGSEVLISYRSLTTARWILTAILPGDEAFAGMRVARERTIEIAVVVGLLVLPLVWLFAWRLLRPLSALRREVERIATDPTSTAVAHEAADEVGRVAQAFNAMLVGQRRSDALRIASDQDRRRLVAILESSQDFVAMTNTDGGVTYLNASGRLCVGRQLNEDLRETRLADYFPAWAVEKLTKEGVPAALAEGIWLGETAVLSADGREIPVDHTVIAHRNVDGHLEFFSSLLHDTSAAKAAAVAMRSSEARMLSIANALPVLVAFIDCDYRYRFVNSRYEEHFAMAQSMMLGKSVVELIGHEAYQAYFPYLLKASRGEMQVFDIDSGAGVRRVHFRVKLIPQFDDTRQLTGYHFIHQDVTDHKVENQRLSQLVHVDALTGLLNRAGFQVAIADAMQRSASQLTAMALFYLDLDRFKSINDQHGHLTGDALLRTFAERLVAAVRSADVVARLGGDEFVVIAEGLRNIEDVRSIAKKILRAMRPAFDLEGMTLSITASVGIAAYTGGPMKAEELIRRADAALYRAKNAGRDRYDLDDPSQDVSASIESGQALELTAIF